MMILFQKEKPVLESIIDQKYCSKNSVLDEFESLIKAANFKYIFLSYNNEGLMSLKEIKEIMSKYGKNIAFVKKSIRDLRLIIIELIKPIKLMSICIF